jgi:tetratricopeptide (TPR) repeat protein
MPAPAAKPTAAPPPQRPAPPAAKTSAPARSASPAQAPRPTATALPPRPPAKTIPPPAQTRAATAAPVKPAAKPAAPSATAVRPAAPRQPPRAEDQYPELAALAEKLRVGNFFALLDVQELATPDQIRRAYELLVKRVHPDRFKSGSRAVKDLVEQVFAGVTEAYQALSDPRKRQEHLLGRKRAEREATRSKQAERALEATKAFRDGDVALKARDYEGALRWFGKALQLYPDEGDHHAHYGYVLYLCHPSDPSMVGEAMEHVRRGLKTASHRELSFLFMGRLHKALGQNEVAEKMFMRAVQLQPDCVEAMRELRLINMRREKSKGLIGRLLKR